VPPRCKHEIQAKRIMITVFFTSTRLLILDALPHGRTFTQNYFIAEVLLMLGEENLRFRRKYSYVNFSIHMDNSRCSNCRKITAKIEYRRLAWAPHPPYSPDRSPCDLWLFGLMKHSLKDREMQGVQALIRGLTDIWDHLTFEDVQIVFLDWMGRFSYVINNNRDYYIK
jgi:hypothetical protein